MLNKPDLAKHVTNNVLFDTCVYHPSGINLLAEMIDTNSIRFGSEMVGAVRNIDPQTVSILTTQNAMSIGSIVDETQRSAIFEHNTRRVFPQLDAQLKTRRL